MKSNLDRSKSAIEVRKTAEEITAKLEASLNEGNQESSSEDSNRLLHELRVHQIELEIQNEELRAAQDELDASRTRYFNLYDLAPVSYCTLSDKGLIQEANLTAATMLGIERARLVKQPFSRFILPADQDIHYVHRKQLLNTGKPQEYELHMMKPDSSTFWAQVTATLGYDDDGLPIIRIVLIDVTERKRTEEIHLFLAKTSSGNKAEPFFYALARYLALSLDMFYVCIDRLEGDGLNATTVAVWCDGHFEDNVTYALRDTPCGDVVGNEICCFPAGVCKFFPRDQVLQDLKADSYIGSTVFSHAGVPIGLIAVIGRSPITNRKRAEDTLKLVCVRVSGELERLEAEEALRKSMEENLNIQDQLNQAHRMEMLGQLAGGVAHDFNNLLTVIMGYSAELSNSLAPDSHARQDAKEIFKAGSRAKELTQQLLIFSRKQLVQTKVMDVNELITNLHGLFFRLIGEHIEIVTKLSPGKAIIKADKSRIEQVVINLVLNSRDALVHGGRIVIETSVLATTTKAVENQYQVKPGGYVLISVCDNGIGIPKAIQSKIFEPFFTTKDTGSGLGLGLSTVYGIVKQAGGSIVVESEPGVATTFTVLLPHTHDQLTSEADDLIKADIHGNGETILIVDDEEALAVLFRKMVGKLGYQVTIANSGAEAICIIESGLRPDLVISDVIMPGMNGKAMADKIKLILPDQKVLFMSGFTDNIIVPLGVTEDGIPFIQKPFTAQEIALKIKTLLY
jgi:PAS domain S-box-containing protein